MDHGCGISWERGLDEGGQVLSRGRGVLEREELEIREKDFYYPAGVSSVIV